MSIYIKKTSLISPLISQAHFLFSSPWGLGTFSRLFKSSYFAYSFVWRCLPIMQVVYVLRLCCSLVVQLKYYHLLLDVVECTSLNTECVMGIHGLLPFILKFCKKRNLRDLSGQTAAIDASCWLHKGLSVSFAQSGRRDRWEIFWNFRSIRFSHAQSWLLHNFFNLRCGEMFQKCLHSVKKAGVTPFVVFDGLSLPAKAGENDRRRRWEKFSFIMPIIRVRF